MGTPRTLRDALKGIPAPIVKALEREYGEIEARFSRRDWSPAEMGGGRLAEALFRYLEWKSTGSFTPIGTPIARLAVCQTVEQDTSLPDGIRFHVRRCADLLMDVRNKRYVGHLGPDIDFYEMDAHLVMRLASWSLSEVIREESGLPPERAQALIDRMSTTHIPLVEEVGGELLVLATHLKVAEQGLVALYHAYPNHLSMDDLFNAVEYDNKTYFKKQIRKRRLDGLVRLKGDTVRLTRKGAAWVEKHIDMTLQLD